MRQLNGIPLVNEVVSNPKFSRRKMKIMTETGTRDDEKMLSRVEDHSRGVLEEVPLDTVL